MILTIFGYPKTGKTTLFNLLTGQKEKVDKFSSSKGDLHKAVVSVPDERLEKLNEFYNTKIKHAQIEYLDTGSLSFGEVKASTFLDVLRRSDGLIHVVRGFSDPEIIHPAGSVNPQRDISSMEDELIISDIITVEKRLERLEKDLQRNKSKELETEKKVLIKIKEFLETNRPLREMELSDAEEFIIRGFQFLSQKPIIHLINLDEGKEPVIEERDNQLILSFYGKIEEEIMDLDEEERKVFFEEYGIKESIRDKFIRESYKLMNLISFFTVGEDEVRAWTIKKGDTAYEAAGKIHTDLQKGFIRAEVIFWEDFVKVGGFKNAKEKALLRLEGKDYKVKDGDIVHIRFNV